MATSAVTHYTATVHSITVEQDGTRLTARIGDAFTVVEAPATEPTAVLIHPVLTRLPEGRLVLAVNRDRDCHDEERLMFYSDDGGHQWQELLEWPTGAARGAHLSATCVNLADGAVYAAATSLLLQTEEMGVFRMPTWRSRDGGRHWGGMEAARVELPPELGEPFDLYQPPRAEQEAALARWRKTAPPAAVRIICEQLGWQRLHSCFMSPLVLGGARLLAFLYFAPRWGEPLVTVCIASHDDGRTWRYLSMPGAYDARFAADSYLQHAVDGLCEPSCTRLPHGELFLVMRLGSRHPLYTVRSRDEGRTWIPDGERGPGCHYADRAARPIAVAGILPAAVATGGAIALCTGRPDVTLSFSLDGGYRWPVTWRFLENDKPEDASTCNNAMIEVAPGRLLLMYDHGGYHAPVPELRGRRRIVGHFIEVETTAAGCAASRHGI